MVDLTEKTEFGGERGAIVQTQNTDNLLHRGKKYNVSIYTHPKDGITVVKEIVRCNFERAPHEMSSCRIIWRRFSQQETNDDRGIGAVDKNAEQE